MKRERLLALALALLVSTTAHAANPPYIEPAESAEQLAHISGSPGITASKKPSPVYVWGIDRKEVKVAEKRWDRPVPVTPGIHKVTVALKGVYQEFDIDFCAGCSFQAHVSYAEESGMMLKKLTTDFWITRQPDGQDITDHKPGLPIRVELF